MKKIFTFVSLLFLLITSLTFGGNDVHAKTIKAPTSFNTSSRAYSTSLTWKKVKGVNGYVVYHRAANNKYKKIKTTSKNSYTHYNLKANAKHYYRVKSYVKKNGKTTYSAYSKTVTIKTKFATYPNVYTFMDDETDSNKSYVVIAVKNKSSKSIYIQNYGDLFDRDFLDYDRTLTLISLTDDERIIYPKSITIKPKKETFILYEVNGSPTWYDDGTTLRFYYYYEGQLWYQDANVTHNNDYIEIDL